MTFRPTTCRRCGAPITQAKVGRVRLFCSAACRRNYHELMRPLHDARPPLDRPLVLHGPDADRRLRALHAELRSTARRCYELAAEMELAGDPLELGRCAAAGAAIERVVIEHFGEKEP